MRVYNLKKNEAVDLTSKKLADQSSELISKEDVQYAEAFEAFKKTLLLKFPDGRIPKRELDRFNLDVKRNYFKQQLQNQLFRVVFRDTEFMKAVDRSVKNKNSYEQNKQILMPQNHFVDEQKVTVVSKGMQQLQSKIDANRNGHKSLDRKILPAFNTEKLSFQPEEYFLKKQVSVFKKGLVMGGGGAKYNQAKEEIERRNRKRENPSNMRKKSLTYRDEPTLDKKGRINDKLY